MGFVRVVEIFPPLFPHSARQKNHVDLERRIEGFIDQARSVRGFADITLVADVKDPELMEVAPMEAVAMLKERARLDAAPVLVVRGLDRRRFLSTVLAGLSLGLGHLMFAWGDDYPARAGSTNLRDFTSLAQAIREAAALRARTKARTEFLSAVNVELLASPGEVARARDRLKARSEYLLAQPPTTDVETLERHSKLLRQAGLEDQVLLNVFPFKGIRDVRRCEFHFGWRLPRSLYRIAEKGQSALVEAEREVVTTLRSQGFPGLYLNTRGDPGVAERLLS